MCWKHHRVCRVSDHPVMFGLSSDPSRPRMSVAGSPRRSPTCRRRKRLAGWWGVLARFIVDSDCGYPFPIWFGLRLFGHLCVGTLIFGTGDWYCFGPYFCGLFTPNFSNCLGTGPCPNHRLSDVGLSCVLVTYDYEQNDVDPTKLQERRG